MRALVAFPSSECLLAGTLDEADGTTGVLIVSGGNEIRCGAHRGMALLAQRLATGGVPVFRFDRRGVGDSEGDNRGYASAGSDIAAAFAAFRREQPQLTHVIGFGNCDAATALLLLPNDCDALVLANPWLGDEAAPPPAAALRRHYARQARSPAAWLRAARNGFLPLVTGLRGIAAKAREQPLQAKIGAAVGSRPTTIVLAAGDRTAQVFAAAVRAPAYVRIVWIDTASHSFAGQGEALAQVLLDAVAALRDKAVS